MIYEFEQNELKMYHHHQEFQYTLVNRIMFLHFSRSSLILPSCFLGKIQNVKELSGVHKSVLMF